MGPDEPDLSRLVPRILGENPRDRDVALYRLAQSVCAKLEVFYAKPKAPPRPRTLENLDVEQLLPRIRSESGDFGRTFGEFRDFVLQHEAQAARRLEGLRTVAKVLDRLLGRAEPAEPVRELLDGLAAFVVREWGLDLDLGNPERDWAMRRVRRYDLLPVSWRTL